MRDARWGLVAILGMMLVLGIGEPGIPAEQEASDDCHEPGKINGEEDKHAIKDGKQVKEADITDQDPATVTYDSELRERIRAKSGTVIVFAGA